MEESTNKKLGRLYMLHSKEKALHFLGFFLLMVSLLVSICLTDKAGYGSSNYVNSNSNLGIIQFLPSVQPPTNTSVTFFSTNDTSKTASSNNTVPQPQVIGGKSSLNNTSNNTEQQPQVIEGRSSLIAAGYQTDEQRCRFNVPSTYLIPICLQELFYNSKLSSYVMTVFAPSGSTGFQVVSPVLSNQSNNTSGSVQVISGMDSANSSHVGNFQTFGGKSSTSGGSQGTQTFGGKVSSTSGGSQGTQTFGGKVSSGGGKSSSSSDTQGTQTFGGKSSNSVGKNDGNHDNTQTIGGLSTAADNLENTVTNAPTLTQKVNHPYREPPVVVSTDPSIVTKLKLNPIADVPWGNNMKVSGQLIFDDRSNNSAHAGQVITFSGTGTGLIPSATTELDGSFVSISSAPSKVGTGWTVQAHFQGNGKYSKTESAILTYNTKEHPTSLTLDVFPVTITDTKSNIENYKVSGVLKDKITSKTLDGKTILFTSDGPIKLSPERTDAKGKYLFSGPVPSAADSSYVVIKAHFNGDSYYESADSLKHTITFGPENNNEAGTAKPQDSIRTASDGSTQGAILQPEKRNHMPIAVASADGIVEESSTVSLTGSKSTDPDGDKLTYSWSQESGPTVELKNSHASNAGFKVPNVGKDAILIFKLTVNDDKPDGKASDSVKIIVSNTDDNPSDNHSLSGNYQSKGIDEGKDKKAHTESRIIGLQELEEKALGHTQDSVENSNDGLTNNNNSPNSP